MFELLQLHTPLVDELRGRFEQVADFYSIHFAPQSPHWSPRFDRGHLAVLMEFLDSECLHEMLPDFFPLDHEAVHKVSLLNRYEFEGSLVGLLLQGTCTDAIVQHEDEARALAPQLISDAACNSASLTAYRMDDPNWSRFTASATISATYCVYNPDKSLWWFLSISDFY